MYRLSLLLDNAIARTVAALVPPAIMRNKRHFDLWQSRGYHVTPVHYYEPVPDTRRLTDELWKEPSDCVGIDFREDEQLRLLNDFEAKYKTEYESFPMDEPDDSARYYFKNGGYGSVDAEVLYCMVRDRKPGKVVEVGSGSTTLLIAQAMRANSEADPQYRCDFTVIDPYPLEFVSKGVPGVTRLRQEPVESVPIHDLTSLGEADILVIDSSHVLAVGSDVRYEFLEILPRLNAGVIVHIHDIFLPWEYPRGMVKGGKCFWTEQYVLQALLAHNSRFEVLFSTYHMTQKHRRELERAFPAYHSTTNDKSSFWIRRTQTTDHRPQTTSREGLGSRR